MKTLYYLVTLISVGCAQPTATPVSSGEVSATTQVWDGSYTLEKIECFVGSTTPTDSEVITAGSASLQISGSTFTRTYVRNACTSVETATISYAGVSTSIGGIGGNFTLNPRSYAGGCGADIVYDGGGTISPIHFSVGGTGPQPAISNAQFMYFGSKLYLRKSGLSGSSGSLCYEVFKP